MKQISSTDLFFLGREFKEILLEQRLDNIFFSDNFISFAFHIKKAENKYLTVKIGDFLFLSKNKIEKSVQANAFTSSLRKYLKNSFVDKIEVIDSERILIIKLRKKDGDSIKFYNLIIEVFKPGNIILTDEDFKILYVFSQKNFKDRKVKAKILYEFPPKKEFSKLTSLDTLKEKFKNDETKIVTILANRFGLGGKFSNEILKECKIENDTLTGSLNELEISNILKELKNLYLKKIDANLIFKKDIIFDFIPFKFKSFNEVVYRQGKTFNDVILEYFSNFLKKEDKKEEEYNKELKKIKLIISKQEKAKNQILFSITEFKNKGEFIYENYSKIEKILDFTNLKIKEIGVIETEKLIKENKKIIRKINKEKQEITIEI